MTPRDITIGMLSTRPVTVSDLAGKLLSHGAVPYLDCVRVAREQLAAAVLRGEAELLEVHGCDLYRIPGSVPVTPSSGLKEILHEEWDLMAAKHKQKTA